MYLRDFTFTQQNHDAKYIRVKRSVVMECIFCKIIKGEIKAKIIKETKNSLAFLDAFPLTKGHALVVPKKHYEKIQDMTRDDNQDLFETVRQVVAKVDSLTGATLVAAHNGRGAGQEIPHVHVHLIPRSKDDSAGPVHSMFTNRPKPSDSEFDQILEKLKS
jgi:histidine triad (HIT) family protein